MRGSMIKPIYELLLWNNCNNNCKFCFMKYNHHDNKFLSDDNKLTSMKKAVQLLESDVYKDGSHVLLVGGELFDTKFSEQTEQYFKFFLTTIVHYMVSGKIDLLYVNTNLIYQDLSYLYFFLNLIKDFELFDRLKFTTSYDICGRFNDSRSRIIVEGNLSKIVSDFPKIKIVVNMIMTKQFCESVLSNRFNVKQFMEDFKVNVNTIPYIILHDYMAATRDQIYKTLLLLDQQMPGYLRAYINNIAIEQDKLLYEYDGEKYVFMTAKNASCGHNENFHLCTVGKNRCFICDMIEFGEALNV